VKLFDDIVREYEGRAMYAEPSFAYLNRSARPAAERIRQTLETWFSHYPSEGQTDLCGRFRSDVDQHHYSAFFELLLHESLLRMGCRVEIHPNIAEDETTKRPDFLVESPHGHRFYIEAVLATGESAEEAAARARMDVVYDAINRLDSPGFFVGMDISGAPDTPPSARHIRAFLKARLDALDPDEVSEHLKLGGIRAIPHWRYEHEGWRIDFHPIPKSPKMRGKSGVRPIGMRSFEAKFVDSSTPIRDAIVAKAGRYGDLELPYVIAVNALDESSVDRIDVMDALFGEEQYIVTFGQSGISESEMSRAPNGAWMSGSGPRYTRVSAVLVAVRLLPWTVGSAGVCLIHNPWAQRPYFSELTRLPQGIPQDGRMEWQDGESLAEVLELPAGWPVSMDS
jgi:hypothetical protein